LLFVCSVTGALGVVINVRDVPVPAAFFTDNISTPFITVSATLVALSLVLLEPFGDDVTELGQRNPLSACGVYITVCSALVAAAVVVPLAAGSDTELVLASLRNLILLTNVGRLTAMLCGVPFGVSVVLLLVLACYTFGWDVSGAPEPWALLLQPAGDGVALLVGGVLGLGLLALLSARRGSSGRLQPTGGCPGFRGS